MILAGIDEAGYGPVLGPLVVGTCAFEVEGAGPGVGSPESELPCLWKLLRKIASKTRARTGNKLHINDSKLVYSTSLGLRELERSVLAVVAASGNWPDGLESLLLRVAPDALPHVGRYPWYARENQERFPLEQQAVSVQMMANGLRAELDRTNCHCVHFAAKLVCEAELNRMFDATRNKSSVLFSLAASHLDYLLRNFADRGLTIICDRQGGREHYGSLLRLMFEDWSLEIVSEQDSRSEYCLSRNGHSARIIFTEKAEAQCMPVALASMLSKYLRESMMHRFNGYWSKLLPGINPTAGYYSDGMRFLGDIELKRRELGVKDAELIRSR